MIYGSGYNQGIGTNYSPLQTSPQGSGIPAYGNPQYSGGISNIAYTGPSQQQQQQGVAGPSANSQLDALPDWAQQYIGKNTIQSTDPNYSQGKVNDYQRQSTQDYQGLAQKYGQDALQNPYFMQQGIDPSSFNPLQDGSVDSYQYNWDPTRQGIGSTDTQLNAFTGKAMGDPTASSYFLQAPRLGNMNLQNSFNANSGNKNQMANYLGQHNYFLDMAKQLGVQLPGDVGGYKLAQGVSVQKGHAPNYYKQSYGPQAFSPVAAHNYNPYGGY